MSALPHSTVRVSHRLVKPSVAINSPLALTVDAGHDIRNVGGSNVFVLSTATSVCEAIPSVPVEESVARRNQFRAQIPYLRARRNRRFELIVDEPSFALALFPPPFVLPSFPRIPWFDNSDTRDRNSACAA